MSPRSVRSSWREKVLRPPDRTIARAVRGPSEPTRPQVLTLRMPLGRRRVQPSPRAECHRPGKIQESRPSRCRSMTAMSPPFPAEQSPRATRITLESISSILVARAVIIDTTWNDKSRSADRHLGIESTGMCGADLRCLVHDGAETPAFVP